jgi:hypothetical protein
MFLGMVSLYFKNKDNIYRKLNLFDCFKLKPTTAEVLLKLILCLWVSKSDQNFVNQKSRIVLM